MPATNSVPDVEPPTVLILGATYTTGNMGVDALLSGSIASVLHARPDALLRVLDYGHAPAVWMVPSDSGEREVRLVNLRFSWKLWLPNNIARLLLMALLLRLLPASARTRRLATHPWLREIHHARLAASLAGGDSFSDIYGLRRLLYVCLPQLLVLAVGRPLVHLPQTLGPFEGRFARTLAGFLMARAQAVFARDEASLAAARELPRGPAFKLHFSHDMAFALEPRPPKQEPDWLKQLPTGTPLVGLNVSGLLYIGGYGGKNQFGLSGDYPAVVREIIRWFLHETPAHVVLISHVTGPRAGAEDDYGACQRLHSELVGEGAGRLHLADGGYTHREIKQLIGRCDFFLGSRMHACIAALSQGVPAIGLAYSRKFAGVFRSIGVEELVIDLRAADATAAQERVHAGYADRAKWRARLEPEATWARRTALGLFQRLLDTENQQDSPPKPVQRYRDASLATATAVGR